jgi:hypothetical protein
MAGGIGPFSGAGVPVPGVNEVQTLTFGGTGGTSTFKIRFKNSLTAAISWSATNATLVANVLAALQALPTIGTGGVTVAVGTMTAGLGTLLVTFLGVNANLDVPAMTIESIVGALTVVDTETIKGVTGTARGAVAGAIYIDTLNGDQYINDGTNHAPAWVMLGIRKAKVALAATAGAGGLLAWLNPEPVTIFVIRLVINLTTKSTGASTAAFGSAVNGTTSSNNLLDAVNLGAAAGVFDNYVNHGAAGLAMVAVPAGQYVTGSQASGAVAGLVGQAHILYMRA